MAGPDPVAADALALHRASTVIDLHVDTLLWMRMVRYDPLRRHRTWARARPLMGHADLPRLEEGGVTAVGLGLVPNPLLRGRRARRLVHGYLDDLEAWVVRSDGRLRVARGAADVEAAKRDGVVAAFPGLEGAHGLGGELGEVAELQARGVRYLGLVHFTANRAARPALGVGSSRTRGLTGWGRELVAECERLQVVVDLAHLNRPGVQEACELARRPVLVTHTGVSGVHESWRNLDDAGLRAVADTGGAVGIILFPPYLCGKLRCGLDVWCRHVEHVAATVGWDHVAIGSDLDGFIATLPDGVRDVADLPLLTAALLRRGNPPEGVERALGANALRVLREACG